MTSITTIESLRFHSWPPVLDCGQPRHLFNLQNQNKKMLGFHVTFLSVSLCSLNVYTCLCSVYWFGSCFVYLFYTSSCVITITWMSKCWQIENNVWIHLEGNKAENGVAGSLVNWTIVQHHCLCGTVSRNRFCLTLLLIMDNVNALLCFVSVFIELFRTQRTSCHWRRKNVDHIFWLLFSLITLVSSNYALLNHCFSSTDIRPISGRK
jgi:hypothetical protein